VAAAPSRSGHDRPRRHTTSTSPLSEEASCLVCTGGLTDPVPAGVLHEVLVGRHEVGGLGKIAMARVRLATDTKLGPDRRGGTGPADCKARCVFGMWNKSFRLLTAAIASLVQIRRSRARRIR